MGIGDNGGGGGGSGGSGGSGARSGTGKNDGIWGGLICEGYGWVCSVVVHIIVFFILAFPFFVSVHVFVLSEASTSNVFF